MTNATPGSWRVGLAVGAFILVAAAGAVTFVYVATSGLREGATAAALAFARDAAKGRAPKGIPRNEPALEALDGATGFETTTTSTSGFSEGMACVTIENPKTAPIRVVVVVADGVGKVTSYGLAKACPCPAKLRPLSALNCSP